MRVISQNGEIDIPYESMMVYRDEKIVYCFNENLSNKKFVLGVYSTDEKAQEAMEMLKEKYLDPVYQNYVGNNEKAFYKTKVFQFPQDSEVEV